MNGDHEKEMYGCNANVVMKGLIDQWLVTATHEWSSAEAALC